MEAQEIVDKAEWEGKPVPFHTEAAMAAKKYWMEQGVISAEDYKVTLRKHEALKEELQLQGGRWGRRKTKSPARQRGKKLPEPLPPDNKALARDYWRSQGYDV